LILSLSSLVGTEIEAFVDDGGVEVLERLLVDRNIDGIASSVLGCRNEAGLARRVPFLFVSIVVDWSPPPFSAGKEFKSLGMELDLLITLLVSFLSGRTLLILPVLVIGGGSFLFVISGFEFFGRAACRALVPDRKGFFSTTLSVSAAVRDGLLLLVLRPKS
jgi:hypothetical protein